jgi:hypothetical protein
MVDDELAHFDDDPERPFSSFDRLFATILPVHFLFLLMVPCWYPIAPFTMVWACLGLLVCRHPSARKNAVLLFVIATWQIVLIGVLLMAE